MTTLRLIGVGRIQRGSVKTNTPVTIVDKEGNKRNSSILQIMGYHGLDRVEVPMAQAGDIVCITGIDGLNISDTICDPQNVEALPPLSVDEPTVSMTFKSIIHHLQAKKASLWRHVIFVSA